LNKRALEVRLEEENCDSIDRELTLYLIKDFVNILNNVSTNQVQPSLEDTTVAFVEHWEMPASKAPKELNLILLIWLVKN
jgi:hypothetical protein